MKLAPDGRTTELYVLVFDNDPDSETYGGSTGRRSLGRPPRVHPRGGD